MAGSMVDALDTLHLMGLTKEFDEGVGWLVEKLDLESVKQRVSVFEANIRVVGGLLSAYHRVASAPSKSREAVKKAEGLLRLARQLGDRWGGGGRGGKGVVGLLVGKGTGCGGVMAKV